MASTIAVLYCDSRGPYPAYNRYDNGVFVDCWDITRDARKYAGPYPVVAHPPCRHWGRLKHLAKVQCRGRFEQRCYWEGRLSQCGPVVSCPQCGGGVDVGDRDCAIRAVEQVRRWGGVLEHPAWSKLWEHCGLPDPTEDAYEVCRVCYGDHENCQACAGTGSVLVGKGPCDSHGGYTIEVDQVEWGHVARKRTWLYLVGVPREALEDTPFPGREPTRSVSGKRGRPTQAAHPGWREQLPRCSDTERRRTPPLFAEYLIRLARSVRR
jgi:hypothetical protein